MLSKHQITKLTTAYNLFKDKYDKDGHSFQWSLEEELALWNEGDLIVERTRHPKNGMVRTIVDYSMPVATGNVAIMTREQSMWNYRKQAVDSEETKQRKSEAAIKRWGKRKLKGKNNG